MRFIVLIDSQPGIPVGPFQYYEQAREYVNNWDVKRCSMAIAELHPPTGEWPVVEATGDA